MTHKFRRVSVTEAARNFADLVNRAFYRQETTVLLKNGVPMAHIAPASPVGASARESLARWKLAPRLDRRDADAMQKAIDAGRAALPPLRSAWD